MKHQINNTDFKRLGELFHILHARYKMPILKQLSKSFEMIAQSKDPITTFRKEEPKFKDFDNRLKLLKFDDYENELLIYESKWKVDDFANFPLNIVF